MSATTTPVFPSLGFIGLGALGLALAEAIDRKLGLAAVWNRSSEKLNTFTHSTVRTASDIQDLCRHCAWVFCCVSDDDALNEVVNKVASAAVKPALFVSFSSCTPGAVGTVERTLEEASIDFLNIPVLGKPDIVRAGKAGYLISGKSRKRGDLLNLFGKLGGTVHDLGTEASTSAAIKLAMNFLIAGMITSFSEAFSQLRSAGADPSLLLKVVENSPLGSPVAKMFGQSILDQAFAPGQFELKLARKDMQYFGDLSENTSGLFLHAAILKHMERTLATQKNSFDWAGLAAHLFTSLQKQ